MRFSVFTHVVHKLHSGNIYAYTPYVKEMNHWISKVDEVIIVSPANSEIPNAIEMAYLHDEIKIKSIPGLYFKNSLVFTKSLLRLFPVCLTIFREMQISDHIHIRCPGNIGLLACIIQILFPKKLKTVKYAGNWDPKSNQPLSYILQKWILNNEFLSRNMRVLVYGNWDKSGGNIVPFFTATYSDNEKKLYSKEFNSPYKFLFVGSIVEGKRPLLAVKIIHDLISKGYDVSLDIYGEGDKLKEIKKYIFYHNLQHKILIHHNQPSEIIKKAYISSHFVILPSRSEGWPKAVAEAMFFGSIPISTNISCVEWMLDSGKRGVLIEPDQEKASGILEKFLKDPESLRRLSDNAQNWSQKYTLEKFHYEIQKFI